MQSPGTSPIGQSESKLPTQNGAPDDSTSHYAELIDYSEAEEVYRPFEELMESKEDRALAKDILKSIIKREQELDYRGELLSDPEIESKDDTTPEPSKDDKN